MTTAATLLLKALIVTTGYVPSWGPGGNERSLHLTLTGGKVVHIVGNAHGYEMPNASPEEVAAAEPVAQHYRTFLRGGELPSAPAGLPTTHHIESEHEGGGLEVFEVAEAKEPKRLAALRGILKDCQCKVVEGVLVDTFSASAFVQIFDRTSEQSREKLLAFDLPKAIRVSFATIKQINERSQKK